MKRSLRQSMLRVIILFTFLICLINIGMSYNDFSKSNKRFAYSTAETVARTCALIIDGDKLDGYLATGRRDTEYYELWNKLLDYKNTNDDIVRLSVIRFDENGANYILDTDLTDEGAFLGDIRPFDSAQTKYSKQLTEGKNVEFINYKNEIAAYESILSSYNQHMGYVVVGISTEHSREKQMNYLVSVTLIAFLVSFSLTIYIIYRFSHRFIDPINQLSEAAVNYAQSVADEKGKRSSFSNLSINTGDEIEQLYRSILKMENDLRTSENTLGIELWNSRHDSMTRLYNKRYLKEREDEYNRCKSLAVFYFDVDNLKKMNDECGHEYGDDVIKKASEYIIAHTPAGFNSFRVGGDEFLMIGENITEDIFKRMMESMKSDPARKLTESDMKVQCRVSLGGAYASGKFTLDDLIVKADQEMYADKQSRRV